LAEDVYDTEAVVGAMSPNDPQSISLFDLELEAPYDAPQGGSFTLTTEFVRVSYESGSSTACCLPAAEGGGSVDLDEFKYPCDDMTPGALISISEPIDDGEQLLIEFRMPFIPGNSSDIFDFDGIFVEVELFLEGEYKINKAATEMSSEYSCPGTCAVSGYPSSNCIEASAATNKVIYGFCSPVTGMYADLLLFVIYIDKGECGSLTGLRVNGAEWQPASSGICAPSVERASYEETTPPMGIVELPCGISGASQGGLVAALASICGEEEESNNIALGSTDSFGKFDTGQDCLSEGTVKLAIEKNDLPVCGVSTFDIIMVSKHILGVEPFTAPWQYIAADVNETGTITTLDQIGIRKLVLAIDSTFSSSKPWKFMPQGFDLVPNTTGENPFVTANDWGTVSTVFDCAEYDLSEGQPAVEAIKIGDLNRDCVLCGSTPDVSGGTTVKVANATTAQDLLNGKIAGALEVPVGASISELMGFQGALRYDTAKLSFDGIRAKDLPYVDTSIIAHSPGVLRLSWYDESVGGESLSAGDRLFELSFSLLSGSFSAGDIWLDTSLMKAEAYLGRSTTTTRHLVLEAPGSGLMQAPGTGGSTAAWQARVHPNPSSGTFELRVNTATAQAGRIVVVDGTGRALYEREAALPKGQSSFTIEAAERWPKGLYFLQLYADGEPVYTEKLIKQ
jgi:hypothetical protein